MNKSNLVFLKKKEHNKGPGVVILLWLGIIIYTLIFTTLQILKYKSFFAFSGEDMADYNQAAINTAKGIPFYCSAGNAVFPNDHFHLVYLLIALPYKIFPHIYTLFFSLTFALASGALGTYLVTRRIFTDYNIGPFYTLKIMFSHKHIFYLLKTFRPAIYFLAIFSPGILSGHLLVILKKI